MESETPADLYPERISKEAINQLPLTAYEGTITLIRDDEAALAACEKLARERVLGFDTETRPAFRKGESFKPALVQLAGEGEIFLFQIRMLSSLDPLIALFCREDILKVGVAIHDDIKGLQSIQPFEPAGFVEIAQYTTPLGIINTGLRALCGIFLGIRISKRAQVSNWARRTLQPAQISYAATDAWVSRELYQKLAALGHVHEDSKCASKRTNS